MKPVFYVKWGPGRALELQVAQDAMIIRGDGLEIDLEPRSIHVEAEEFTVREYGDEKRRWVYIDLPRGVRGIEAPRIDIDASHPKLLGLFEVRLTEVDDIDRYLTIVTPGGFLYDYVILTGDKLMFETKARRKLYRESVPGESLTIYLV